jgi:hypothetical protein
MTSFLCHKPSLQMSVLDQTERTSCVRHSSVEAEHNSLQAKDERNIKVPARQQTLRPKLQLGYLCVRHLGAHLVGYTNVGSILACQRKTGISKVSTNQHRVANLPISSNMTSSAYAS